MPRTDRRFLVLALALVAGVSTARASDLPPTEGEALLKWLQSGAYKAWPKESAPHRSMGAHETLVVTHLNPALDKSMHAKAAAHPQGSAAVKELLDAGGKLMGWALAMKTAAQSDGGKGWFWYEILGTTPGSPVTANGQGAPACIGCHARGRDGLLSEHPLD